MTTTYKKISKHIIYIKCIGKTYYYNIILLKPKIKIGGYKLLSFRRISKINVILIYFNIILHFLSITVNLYL